MNFPMLRPPESGSRGIAPLTASVKTGSPCAMASLAPVAAPAISFGMYSERSRPSFSLQ